MDAINIKDLVKTYQNGVQALKDINLEVKEGDFFALLGANGAGKTTIISILTSIVNKTSGDVKVFGYDLDTQTNLVKQSIGVVPQEFNISIFEKVQDIVVNQAGYYGMPLKEATQQTEIILKKLDLWEKRDQIAKNLSGGMKRRLMIARALVHNPKLLILDEPTAGVDVELRYGMWQYLNELNAQGTTILLTTHYLEEVEQLCKNAAIIKEGEIIKNDSVKNLVNSLDTESYLLNIIKIGKAVSDLKDFTITKASDDTLEIDIKKGQNINQLIKELDNQDIKVTNIQPRENRLEKLFLNILSK
jgi:ABC-2 type transport system ATP-binding protein